MTPLPTAQAPSSVPPSGRSPSPIQAPSILRQAIVLLREQSPPAPDAILARFATEQSPPIAPLPGSLDTMIRLIERSHQMQADRRASSGRGASISFR